MLVLSRKRGEKTILETKSGELIEATVVEIRGDKVRLGFEAHHSIKIHREELIRPYKAGNQPLPPTGCDPMSTEEAA